jgi:hypothetical protein
MKNYPVMQISKEEVFLCFIAFSLSRNVPGNLVLSFSHSKLNKQTSLACAGVTCCEKSHQKQKSCHGCRHVENLNTYITWNKSYDFANVVVG